MHYDYFLHLRDRKRWIDPDPPPTDWSRTDPHSRLWERYMLDQPDYEGYDIHLNPPTSGVKYRRTNYMLGRHQRHRVTRLIVSSVV